jgi:tryptophan synthase alpha subunit
MGTVIMIDKSKKFINGMCSKQGCKEQAELIYQTDSPIAFYTYCNKHWAEDKGSFYQEIIEKGGDCIS